MPNVSKSISIKTPKPQGRQRKSSGGKVTVRVKTPGKGPNPRRRGKARNTKVIVTTAKSGGKSRDLKWDVNTRKYGSALSIGSSATVRKYVMQALLPYNCVPSRILEDANTNDDPTAVTSNYEYYDINLTKLMKTNLQIIEDPDVPRCGALPGGSRVWGDFQNGVPIVSIMDTRLLAIVPERTNSGLPRTVPCTYRTTAFMNPNQLSPGKFVLAASNESLGFLSPADQFRMLDPDVLWLDMLDLYPVKYELLGYDTPYGPFHPVLDADNSRYFWIDAHPTATSVAHDNNGSVVEVTFTPRTGMDVDALSTGQQDTVKLVVEKLSTSTMESDKVLLMADFENQLPDHLTRAGVPIQVSGYYRIGIKGLFNDTLMSTANGRFADGFEINYHLSRQINVVSRHIVNSNCVLVTNPNSHVMQVKEQCLSASMLISNSTPEASRGGRVYASILPNGSNWQSLTSDLSKLRSSVQNANRKYAGDLSKGVYGWLHCQNYGFRPFNDVVNFIDSGSEGCLRSYSLTQKTTTPGSQLRGCNVYYLQPPAVSGNAGVNSNSFGDQVFTLQMAVNFEYTTQSLIPITSPVLLNSAVMQEVRNILMVSPTFTENPLHIADFKKIAESAGNFYKNNRGKFQTAFSALSSFGHPLLKALGLAASAADNALLG